MESSNQLQKIMKNSIAEGAGRVILVDKPRGPTSHDIVVWTRRTFGTSRVGHAGTLDPFASGLLVLMVGWATRTSQYLANLSKVYRATIKLGVSTDTDDSTGVVIKQNQGCDELSEQDVREVLKNFEGRISQRPPQYSAKKVRGERMYRKARRGEWVQLDPIEVEVHRIILNEFNSPLVELEIDCSSGTYIRALARDIGEMMGMGAHLTSLRRLSIGKFSVDNSMAAEELREGKLPDQEQQLEITNALGHLGSMEVEGDVALKLRNGMSVKNMNWDHKIGETLVVSSQGELVGMVEVDEEVIRPRKIVPKEIER